MAKLLKLRRGTTTQHSSFTGAEGEVTIDTTKDTAVVHDGSQAGGRPLAREDMSNVSSIAGTKISPDFGSQNITTTGELQCKDMSLVDTTPKITFFDSDNNPDFTLSANSGSFRITDSTNSAERLVVNSDGHVDVLGNLDVGAGVDVTGNVTASGNIDATGFLRTGGTYPRVYLTDSDNDSDWVIINNNGGFVIRDDTNGTSPLTIAANGQVTVNNNLDVTSGADITGTCTATTFSGSGASLTNLPAANLTGTLPALDGSNLTGIAGIPSGVIAIWSGATNAIPSGWVLCDGNNSTPDLRDKFVVGANTSSGDTAYPGLSVGATGGASSSTASVSVNGNTGWASQYANASSNPNASPEPFNSRDRHQHGWGGTFTSSSFNILPPYYALAFIMKS